MVIDNIQQVKFLTRHTNRTQDEANYIDPDKYPTQLSIVGTRVNLRYRDHYIVDKNLLNVQPYIIDKQTKQRKYSRPADDTEFIPREVGPESSDPQDIYTDKFLILRADAVEPFRLVAVNDSYTIMLVNSTRGTEVGYEFETLISEYPIQFGSMIGAKISTYYKYDKISRDSYILLSDASESMYGVYIEKIVSEEGNKVRYLFEDEVITSISDTEYNKILNTTTEYSKETIASIRKNIIENIF